MSNCIAAICKCGNMVFAARKDMVTAGEVGRYALDGHTVKTINTQAEFVALEFGCKCKRQHDAPGPE